MSAMDIIMVTLFLLGFLAWIITVGEAGESSGHIAGALIFISMLYGMYSFDAMSVNHDELIKNGLGRYEANPASGEVSFILYSAEQIKNQVGE